MELTPLAVDVDNGAWGHLSNGRMYKLTQRVPNMIEQKRTKGEPT